MSRKKTYRPAWFEMGWWKWLSIVLVVFSLVIIIPYTQLAGGSHELRGELRAGRLGDCPIDVGIDQRETSIRLTAKMKPTCAWKYDQLKLELIDQNGNVLAHTSISGSANALSAKLALQSGVYAKSSHLQLRTAFFSGKEVIASWPL